MAEASSSSCQYMLQARRTVSLEDEEGESKTSNDDDDEHNIIVAYRERFEEWHVGTVWSVGVSEFVSPDAAGAAPPSLAETETVTTIITSNNNPRQAMVVVNGVTGTD